jgi:hypothetical protein
VAQAETAIMKLTGHRSSSVVQKSFQRQALSASSMTAGTKKPTKMTPKRILNPFHRNVEGG